MTKILRQRVLSGIQPSGKITLGNYVGAISQWLGYQETHETFFCIVDLHTLTLPEDMTPAVRRQKSLETAAIYLACGIDPKKSAIFIQSKVPIYRSHKPLFTVFPSIEDAV